MKSEDKPCMYFENIECLREYRADHFFAEPFSKAYVPTMNLPPRQGLWIIARDAYLSEIIGELAGDGDE